MGGPPTTEVCFATGHRVVVPGAVARGWNVWGGVSGGAVGLGEKGSCQTGIADPMQRGNSRKASAHFPFEKKKGVAAALVNKERRCSFRALTLQDVLDRSHA